MRIFFQRSIALFLLLSALSCSLAADEPNDTNRLEIQMQQWRRQPCVPWSAGARLPTTFQAGFVETLPGLGGLWLRADRTALYFCTDGIGCSQLKGHWRIVNNQILVTYVDDAEAQICEQILAEEMEYCEKNCVAYRTSRQAQCRKLGALATGKVLRIRSTETGILIDGQLMHESKSSRPPCLYDLGNRSGES